MRNKILIIGDSYAEWDYEGTWPNYLREFLDAEVICKGIGGGSNYTALVEFKKNIDESFTHIIPVLTNYHRIPIVIGNAYLCAFSSKHPRFDVEDNLPHGYRDALSGYFKYFYDNEFLNWLSFSVIRDIMENSFHHQQILWLDALLGIHTSFYKQHIWKGVMIKGMLTDVSLNVEIKEGLNIDPMKFMYEIQGDPRPNHLSKENQKRLGKFLADIIKKTNTEEPLTDEDIDLMKVDWNTDGRLIYSEFEEHIKGLK